MIRWLATTTIVALIAMAFGIVGTLQYNSVLQIGVLADVTRKVEDSVLSRLSRSTPPQPRLTLVNLLPLEPTSSARPAAANGADRGQIANILDTLRSGQDRPLLVIVDIDISVMAPDSLMGESAQETDLLRAIKSWVDDGSTPNLLLARGASCNSPPREWVHDDADVIWSATPFDGLVAPTAQASTKAGWFCPITQPRPDRQVRSMLPVGCGCKDQECYSAERFPIPSAGSWASEIDRVANLDLTAISQARRLRWADGCEAVHADEAAARPQAIAPTAPETRQTISWNPEHPPLLQDFNGDIVVIGQDFPGAGDVWAAPGAGRLPGMALVGENVRSSLRSSGKLELGPVGAAALAFTLGWGISAVYFACVALRQRALDGDRSSAGWALTASILLSPPLLILAVGLLMGAGPLIFVVAQLSPNSWGSVFASAGAAYLALVMVDFVLTSVEYGAHVWSNDT